MAGTLDEGLVRAAGETSSFHVAPLQPGATPVQIAAPRFFFGHTVNAFSRGGGNYTVDLVWMDDIFFDRRRPPGASTPARAS